ncbi:hypothetical protein D3C72_1071500 [compost metagenome]
MGEDDGAVGRRRGLQLTRHLDHADRARGVVPGAVEDLVVARGVLVDADVVPVGRIDDGLVGTLGPRNLGQQIVGAQGVDGLRNLNGHTHARHIGGAKIATAQARSENRHIQPKRLGRIRMNRGRELQIRRTRRLGTGAARALNATRPGPVRRCGVDDRNDAYGATALGFIRLVGAGFIVGRIGAVEKVAVRLPGDDDDHLARHIKIAVVVPPALGRMDAVAGEDQAHIGDRSLTVIRCCAQGDVGSRRQDMDLTVRAGPAGLGGVRDGGVAL